MFLRCILWYWGQNEDYCSPSCGYVLIAISILKADTDLINDRLAPLTDHLMLTNEETLVASMARLVVGPEQQSTSFSPLAQVTLAGVFRLIC